MANNIQRMISVTLPDKLWDELSELVWDNITCPPCEGCAGDGCDICHGTGEGTMYHPSLDGIPIVEAARVIDQRIVGNMSPASLRALNNAMRGGS